jgi:hypothetical protein
MIFTIKQWYKKIMKMINSNKIKIITLEYRKFPIKITIIDPISKDGEWLRVFRKPDKTYVAKTNMSAPKDWEFVLSYFYIP